MIAVDTNILVYAETPSSSFHDKAREILEQNISGTEPWAIPWPCIYEFLRVITHPRFMQPPIPIEVALEDVRVIVQSPSLHLFAETPRHAEIMDIVMRESGATSNTIFDARIAALCIEHGVTEILTADRDFARFPIKATNPFLS